MALITPHLRQAFAMNRLLHGQSLERLALANLPKPEDSAVLCVNRLRRITYANPNAERMLGDGIILKRDQANRLLLADQASAFHFTKALSVLDRQGKAAPSGFLLGRAGEQDAPFVCRTRRLDPSTPKPDQLQIHESMSEPTLLLTLLPRTQQRDLSPRVIKTFSLTPQEANIALKIAQGKSPRQIAREREVSIHTVRNQLKSAMAKMEVHRQAQLVKEITRLDQAMELTGMAD